MSQKLKKALAITVAALQIPMLALWKIVYDAAKMDCHTIRMREEGAFTLGFDPSKFLGASLTYAPFILLLVACMALSVWGLVRYLAGKNRAGITAAFLYGGIAVACVLLVFGFSYYNNSLFLAEYMFYCYPFGLVTLDFLPRLQSIKYILLGLTAALSAVLCVGEIAEMKKHK